MTMIYVNTKKNRLTIEQRRLLAETLTDAVLIPEVGQYEPNARMGFQVHFIERDTDNMAIGGKLLCDYEPESEPDTMTVNIRVMDSVWPKEVRKQVIENVLARLAEAFNLPKPLPTWWVTFEVIDEGSWGSSGSVLSIFDLLNSGVFTKERVDAIRKKIK